MWNIYSDIWCFCLIKLFCSSALLHNCVYMNIWTQVISFREWIATAHVYFVNPHCSFQPFLLFLFAFYFTFKFTLISWHYFRLNAKHWSCSLFHSFSIYALCEQFHIQIYKYIFFYQIALTICTHFHCSAPGKMKNTYQM